MSPGPTGEYRVTGSGIGKKKSGSGSRMKNQDHISKRSESPFWVKIVKFFDVDPVLNKFGSRTEKFGFGIQDIYLGSATLGEYYSP
jgi:hypothetical protein